MKSCSRNLRGLWVGLLAIASLAWAPALAARERAVTDLPSVINFRDLGGRRTLDGSCVRRGLLFRSANFTRTTAADAAELTRRTGVRVYYDLRSPGEIERFGAPTTLMQSGVRWQRMPIDAPNDPIFKEAVRGPEQWSAFYLRLVEQKGDVFARLLEDWAHGEVPATFSCSFGKDRTGVASALLLLALGVDQREVVDDYIATGGALTSHASAFEAYWLAWHIPREEFLRMDMRTYPETLTLFIAGLKQRYGSIDGALHHVGLTDDSLKALKARFLAPGADCAPS